MKVYVLVKVTYDYYRFQENISAQIADDYFDKSLINKKNYPIYKYVSNGKKQKKLDKEERTHYWIQKFDPPL